MPTKTTSKKPTKPAPPTKPAETANHGDQFRAAIRAAMRAQDHDIATTAKGAGIHRSTLIRWLNGTRDMSVSKLSMVLAYLGIR